jgi:hypothetical protein
MAEIISLLSDSEGEEIHAVQISNKRTSDVIDITSDDDDSSCVFKDPRIRHTELDESSGEENFFSKFSGQNGNMASATSSRSNHTTAFLVSFDNQRESDNEVSLCKNGNISRIKNL